MAKSDIQFSGWGKTWVLVSHAGQRLADGSNGVSHSATADLSLAGSQVSTAVSMPKHLEERDWVGVLHQGGVQLEVVAELLPNGEDVSCGIPSGVTDAQGEALRNNAKVRLEMVSGVAWASFHGWVVGKRWFNWQRNS